MTDLRLRDLQPHETLRIYCGGCGSITEWMQGYIHQRLLQRLSLEMSLAELARRLRCERCGKGVAKLTIFDENYATTPMHVTASASS
jgi:ribosomal protein S27AE